MDNSILQLEIDFTGRLPAAAQLGMAQADEHADEGWRRVCDAAILAVARRLPEFTTDDIWQELGAIANAPSTHARCAIGPRMKRVAREMGWMESTGRVQRSRAEGMNGNYLTVWRSLVYSGGTAK